MSSHTADGACQSWHAAADQHTRKVCSANPQSLPHLRQLRCHVTGGAAQRAALAARRPDPASSAVLAEQVEHGLPRLRLRCLEGGLQCCTVQLQHKGGGAEGGFDARRMDAVGLVGGL